MQPGDVYTGQEPTRVERVSFTRKRPQLWFDTWRNRDRICRYRGDCISCGRRCFGFDDGENDPRGVLGDHAVSMFYASDYDMVGPDVVACFMCQNDYDLYNYGLELARKRWADSEQYSWSHRSATWQVEHGEPNTPRTLSAMEYLKNGAPDE
jgi:hypothetical protein